MKVHLPQLNKTIPCEKGQNLFKLLRQQDVPVASSCLGDGICGKCVLKIEQGTENLSPPTELELKLKEKYKLTNQQRISCQCQVLGDVGVRSTYW
jgi:ferredoxin, 2Fe-2S